MSEIETEFFADTLADFEEDHPGLLSELKKEEQTRVYDRLRSSIGKTISSYRP